MTDQHPLRPPPRKQTGVPRRFGVGVMLVIMTMYAVLFAVLQQTPAGFFVTVALFFTIVGLAQAILYKGRNPRKASIVTGAGLGLLLALIGDALALVLSVQGGAPFSEIASLVLWLLFAALCGVVFGALFGYLAGGLTAGVFLLFNKVQPPLEDPADEKPAEEDKTPDPPADAAQQQRAPGVSAGIGPQQDAPA